MIRPKYLTLTYTCTVIVHYFNPKFNITNRVAEMGFLESPLTSQPKFTKGLSRGEWSVG